jgi:uncharacterized membrane protein
MFHFIIYVILVLILMMLIWMTYHFRTLSDEADNETKNNAESDIYKNKLLGSHNFIYAAIVLVIITLLVYTYLIVKGTPLESHMMEWLNIVVRVMHITFGIAWIGASFYFVFLENALNRTENVRDELAGNLWAIHGGGFYFLEKYKTAPKVIPKHLHWFKYESYFTWLTGFSLLFIVYYFNAKGFLIDTNVYAMSTAAAIVTGIGSFVVAWLLYDILCKTPLVKKGIWFTLIGVMIVIGFAWFYCHVFSARAAYIHFGAMLGSIMVANVFFVIIPSQKAMVKAAREGKPLNPELGKHAGLRSLHNNYLTLPVLFVMVSNHFPSTFGFKYPWIILAAISLGSAGIKHWLNLREKGKYSVWVMPVSVLILLATAYVSAPPKPGECKDNISFTDVNAIVQRRCITCHSATPTDDIIKTAPNGVMYDMPENIVKLKDKIMQRVVITKTMPQNNKTNMTQEERDIIRCWIEQGAILK